MDLPLSYSDTAGLLAGLRLLQLANDGALDVALTVQQKRDLMALYGDMVPLTNREIDVLCEKINLSD